MPKLIGAVPKLCRHLRGQAFVKIAGQQVWLMQHCGEAAMPHRYLPGAP